jgi:hypothetical protein
MSRVEGCDYGRRAGFALMQPLLAGLLCLAVLTSCPLLAQTGVAKTPLPSNRCLLVVETSRSMQRRADGVVLAVQKLLKSGLAEQLRPGDTLGVWTYNESLYAGRFPLQTWSPEAQEGITLRTVAFLKEQKYEKQASFDKVLPALSRLISGSPLITIILISSADETIHGTLFDAQINEFYQKWQDVQQKARMPFVTVLRARDGQFADFTVNTPPWPVQMPRMPQEVQMAETVQTPVTKAVRTLPPPIAQPRILSGTGKKSQPEEAPAPKPSTAPLPVPEPKREIAKGPETKPIASPPATPDAAPAPPPPAPEPVAVPAAAGKASSDADAARPLPAAPSTVSVPPVQTATAVPAGTLVGWPIIWIAGLVLAGVAIGLVILLRRRSHAAPGASLITQSFERKNKP